MKILLVAVNSKFNHTNIAVRSIVRYVKKNFGDAEILFDEWTINMPVQEILSGIHSHKADTIIFSTYIWNSEIIQKILKDIKKILPKILVGAGGPEAGFDAENWLKKNEALDFVVCGEGEKTILEINEKEKISQEIKGLYIKENGEIKFTGERDLICNLDELPFPYEKIEDPDNRIYYFESSRGCPFNCSYCMSSLDKRVRFFSLERTCGDIQKFLDANVALVKFVDRTYNLNEERYLKIWQYILDHHNGKTMFHFEIEAEFLSEAALNFLQKVPENVMQFEIGIQSCNPKTLEAVGRSKEIKKLFENIKRIPKTIHTHLDLIAGLPFEDLNSFRESFEKVLSLKPDALQLGFLKVLHGTVMKSFAGKNGWQWMTSAPYEVLSTPYLSYEEILFLKDVEILTDAIYNSGIFSVTANYIGRKIGWKKFFFEAAEHARKSGALDDARKNIFWFKWLADYFAEDKIILQILKFDYMKLQKTSCFPEWMNHIYKKENHLEAMNANEKLFDNRIEFAFSDYDEFSIDPLAEHPEETSGTFKYLFVYKRHNSKIKNCQIKLN